MLEIFYCIIIGIFNPLQYILYYLICKKKTNIQHLYALYIVIVLNTILLMFPLSDLFGNDDTLTVGTLFLNVFILICLDMYLNKRELLFYFIAYIIFFIISINIYDSLNLGVEYDMYIMLFLFIALVCFILLYKYMQARKKEKVAYILAYTTKYIALCNPNEEDLYAFIYDALGEAGLAMTTTNCMIIIQQLMLIEQGTLNIIDKYKIAKDVERKIFK